jgi:hypothetical protein
MISSSRNAAPTNSTGLRASIICPVVLLGRVSIEPSVDAVGAVHFTTQTWPLAGRPSHVDRLTGEAGPKDRLAATIGSDAAQLYEPGSSLLQSA